MAQMVKNLPAKPEIQVQSLDREYPLKKGWQPTPVFLPGESHGQRSLAGYSPGGPKKSDTIEQLTFSLPWIYYISFTRSLTDEPSGYFLFGKCEYFL